MTDLDCPGFTGEEHPELFDTLPVRSQSLKPGQLSEERVKQFYQEGFLLIEDFFTREELDPCREAVDVLVDDLATRLHEAGKIKSDYKKHGFKDRMTLVERDFPGANVILHKLDNQPQAVRKLGSNERLLNVVEQLLGTADIAGHPSWNLRVKTPGSPEANVPWHQDNAYFDNSTYGTLVIVGWIPLLDTTSTNGCLQLVRYGHRKGKVVKHVGCYKSSWFVYIEEEEMSKTLGVDLEKDIITCPVPYGGLLLFTNFTPHRSPPNTSDEIRWSIDFRWMSAENRPGMFDTQPSIRMRSSTDPNFQIDWDSFFSVSRHKNQFQQLTKRVAGEFDTTNGGPWMLKWPIVNENRHSDVVKDVNRKEWLNIIRG